MLVTPFLGSCHTLFTFYLWHDTMQGQLAVYCLLHYIVCEHQRPYSFRYSQHNARHTKMLLLLLTFTG